MIELPNGKIARTLPEQVAFLTDKVKELIVAFNQSGLKKIEIVEELPEVGDPAILYLLAVEDPEEGNYYEEYLWIDGAWEIIGTTQVDLSNYVTLDSEQTITGTKAIQNKLKFNNQNEVYKWRLEASDNDFYITDYNNNIRLLLRDSQLQTNNILPLTNGTRDIGAISYTYKDLYLSGIISLYGASYTYNIENNGSQLKFYINGSINGIFLTDSYFAPLNSKDLGNLTDKWKDLYLSGNIYLNYAKIVADANYFRVNSSTSDATIIYANTSNVNTRPIRPLTDSSFDLGAASLKWKDLYLSGNLNDGTNSIAVADIGKKLYKHTIQTDGGGGADLFILSTRSSAYVLPIDWLSLNTEAVKFLYNGCLVLRIYESGGVYYAQYINDSNSISNSALSASTIEDTVAAL